MNIYLFVLLLVLFLATSLTAFFVLSRGAPRVLQWASLESGSSVLHRRAQDAIHTISRGMSWTGRWLMDRLEDVAGRGIVAQRHTLVIALTTLCRRAGFQGSSALPVLMGIQAFGFLILPILSVIFLSVIGQQLSLYVWALTVLALAAIGAYVPVLVLRLVAYRRKQQILRSFPEALDLIMICVEAGLGLDAAIQRVGEEFKHSCQPLYQEFRTLSLELRTGVPRSAAFINLADRIDTQDIRNVVATLTQADRLGTSLLDAVRIQSEQLRLYRRLKAEERAAKIGTKLLFPLIFFLFPALFLVLVGPAVLSVIDHFPRVVSP
jgi:tight adherence protein C